MKLAHPEIESVFDFSSGAFNTIVIENQNFMRKFLTDIKFQTGGLSGEAVLSEKNAPIPFSKNAELIDSVLGFTINQKNLLNKIAAAIFHKSVAGEYFLKTSELVSQIEQLIDELSFDFPCSLIETKLNFENVIKSAGVEILDDYENGLERFIDYMELVREFDRDKLFVFANLRSFYADEDVEFFAGTVIAKEFNILLVDNCAKKLLNNEKRVIIDSDLCEIYLD